MNVVPRFLIYFRDFHSTSPKADSKRGIRFSQDLYAGVGGKPQIKYTMVKLPQNKGNEIT